MAPMTVPLSPGRPAARSLMAAGGHVRSASVPCYTHPLLMDVDEQLLALRSWTSNPGQNPLSLAHVRALLCVLDELLHLPLAQGALVRGAAARADSLLDGFLVLADAFGTFLAALLALRQHAAELRAAVRRRDAAKLASAARAQRQVGKELEQLAAAAAREAARCARASLASSTAPAELEIARTVAEAVNDTAAASASVFSEVGAAADAAAALASPASSSPKKRLPLVNASSRSKQQRSASEERREAAALGKLQELEQCVGELESESEKVFRSLVQTRVSLLNIHTPTF
ncbi:LOW QUALITY PROTEIN: hypothetical protein GQ55_4G008300 [Panicum hallii var. hallii]|uniref:DUF241 domain-containing protein n=1 Tax=Panicum hallii var. hallii TaxID=1504633 RepID=A0A2T7DTW0_9POAL|nr:LOW QUALITY PROTEIN: hypothetical protein GQ55_4G008300 [Panicum hallii var. hallii]